MMGMILATEHGESSFLQVFSSRGVPHGKETLLNMKWCFCSSIWNVGSNAEAAPLASGLIN
jgi:hypothetical protein